MVVVVRVEDRDRELDLLEEAALHVEDDPVLAGLERAVRELRNAAVLVSLPQRNLLATAVREQTQLWTLDVRLREAAHLAGIKVPRTKVAIFMLSGMAAAFAGTIAASRLAVASNNAGEKLELQAISACVLGGVSLSGGVGTISGTVVGVLIMGIVENVMRLRNVDAFYQMVVTGLILLAAVLFDRLKLKVLRIG